MSKQIIVRLRTGSVTGPIVANSQVITIDGLGSGPIRAQDFEDGLLQGSVSTASQLGTFFKKLIAPTWTLNPVSPTVNATASFTFNWTVSVPNTATNLKWYAVTVGTETEYSGPGITTRNGTISYITDSTNGSITVPTTAITADTQFQLTLWNGNLGTGTLLARSPVCKIVGVRLSVTGPSSVYFNEPINITIKGYPAEKVTYSGATNGTIILDNTGTYANNVSGLDPVTGLPMTPPGNYSWTFDGDKTPNVPTYTVSVTAKYTLAVNSPNPATFNFGDPLQIAVSGAPNETVSYVGVTDPSNKGNISLNNSGTATHTITGTPPVGNYVFKLKGNLTPNEITYTAKIVNNYALSVTGPSPVTENVPITVTISGAPNEQITYTYVAPAIPNLYFDYYPDVAGAFAINSKGMTAQQFAEDHYNNFGQAEGRYSPTALAGLSVAGGTFVLDSNGGLTGNISLGLPSRTTPYSWKLDGNKTTETPVYSVTVAKSWVLGISLPTTVTSDSRIDLIITGAPGETVTYTGSASAVGNDGSFVLDASGRFTGDISGKDPTTGLPNTPPGTYTWVIKGNKTPNTVNKTVIVTAAKQLTLTAPTRIKFGSPINITLNGVANEIVTYRYQKPTATYNAYFDYYPDVAAAFLKDSGGMTANQYANSHYAQFGSAEGRMSPTTATSKFENEPSTTPGTFTLDGSGVFTVDLSAGGSYNPPARTSPYVWALDGDKTPNTLTYSLTVDALSTINVTGPASVQYGAPIVVTISGAPNELISYTGTTTGSAPLDGTGSLTADINPNKDLRGGTYSWTVSGNKSSNTKTYTVVVVSSQLQINGPANAAYGSAISITINGLPNEVVTYTGTTTGSYTLNNTGSFTFDLNPNRDLPVGTYQWSLKGNKTTNTVSYSINITASYQLKVTGPSTAAASQPIKVTVSGAPNEAVTAKITSVTNLGGGAVTGMGTPLNTTYPLTLGANGTLTQDITNGAGLQVGSKFISLIYTIEFDGDKTPNVESYKITIAASYTLAVTGPSQVSSNQAINISITGAPSEAVNYTGTTNGTFNLDATGTFNADISGRDGSNNIYTPPGVYTWTVSGNKTTNSPTYSVTVVAAYTLKVVGPASVNQGQPANTTITGAPNEIVVAKSTAATLYFIVNPDVAAAYKINTNGKTPIDYANTHYTLFGQSEGRTSPTQLASAGVNLPLNAQGTLAGDLFNGAALPAGAYSFTFDGDKTPNTVTYSVTLNASYVLSAVGPTTLATGQPITVTIKGAPNETVNFVGSGAAAGATGNLPLNSNGELTGDITGGIPIAPGTYTYTLKGNKTTNTVTYTVVVTGANALIEFGLLAIPYQEGTVNLYGFRVGPAATNVKVEIMQASNFTVANPGTGTQIYNGLPTNDEFNAEVTPGLRRGNLNTAVNNFTGPYTIGTSFAMKIWVTKAGGTETAVHTFSGGFQSGG